MSKEKQEAMPNDQNVAAAEKKPVLIEKGEISEFVKTALLAVALALIIRSLLFEPFNIPSGSMKPTLLVGDYLFVNKPSYGYSRFSFPFGLAPIEERMWPTDPKRGDVIVFALPTNTNIDYIKRIVGLPGDNVMMRRGRLYINGTIVPRERIKMKKIQNDNGDYDSVTEYTETLPGGITHKIYEISDYEDLDNTELFTVPEGHYFAMGDNRDRSQDSRVTEMVGFIPFKNIVGRADFLFFSTNNHARLFELWKWPWSIRYDRLFMDIDPTHPEGNENSPKVGQ